MKKRTLSVFASAALTAAILLNAGVVSAATVYVNYCLNTSSNVVLTGDVTTDTTGTCFGLFSGANLDLNGYEIICNRSGGDCGTAVDASDQNGSTVEGPGSIYGTSGNWDLGIQDAKKVQNIFVAADQAVIDHGGMVLVDESSFLCFSTTEPCVDAVFNSSTDTFSDNTFIGANSTFLELQGKSGSGRGPTVKDNTLHGVTNIGIKQIGIAKKFRAFRNVVNDCAGCPQPPVPTPFDSEGADNGAFSLTDTAQWDDNVCSDEDYCPTFVGELCECPGGAGIAQCTVEGLPLCL